MRTDFTEIADRVWVLRHEWFDVNLTVVGGAAGLVVVDTLASSAEMGRVRRQVRALGAGDAVAVVNTHDHFDHVLGNDAWPGVPIHAHEVAVEALVAFRDARTPYDGPRAEEVRASRVVIPDRPFSSAAVIDLGDRQLELLHPGRGHTAGDLVVRVPDADVLLAGDLVEESAPPAYGADSWPLEWPGALDFTLSLTTPDTVVVPGHGAVVDRSFVEEQRDCVAVVADTIRNLAGNGTPAARALVEGEWPWPVEVLEHAVRRGYAHLPRSARQLPLV